MNAEHPLTLQGAIDLARRAHRGAVDKAGLPYIEHPLRVMAAVQAEGEQAMMAAILHDVLEDTSVTAADLQGAGCPPEVVVAVERLTRRDGETYLEFVHRIAQSGDRIAIMVKLADVEDNAAEDRLALLPDDEASRLREKYRAARRIFEGGTAAS